jgi:xanthine dehydrogenase accessory factor
MICAGSQTNLYYLCRPQADGETVDRLASVVAEGRSGTLRIDRRGMSLAAEAPDLERPQRRLERRGDEWLYEEELLNRRRLAILGGGHCALALARLMARLGYDVLAFEGPQKEPVPELAEHVRSLETVADFRAAGGRVAHPELTWVVVMTSDFPSDVRALAGVLPRPFPFVGVMGSPAKLREIRRRLGEEGFSDDVLARITAPVGLPIGSETPEEIAVSVAAQILKLRNA